MGQISLIRRISGRYPAALQWMDSGRITGFAPRATKYWWQGGREKTRAGTSVIWTREAGRGISWTFSFLRSPEPSIRMNIQRFRISGFSAQAKLMSLRKIASYQKLQVTKNQPTLTNSSCPAAANGHAIWDGLFLCMVTLSSCCYAADLLIEILL